MFVRVVVPMIIAGVFAALLIGWAVAYWYDRRQREREDAERDGDQ